jgi:hypothetical protein
MELVIWICVFSAVSAAVAVSWHAFSEESEEDDGRPGAFGGSSA